MVQQPPGQLIRNIILDQSYRAKVGHIGSSLSIADIIAAIYCNVMRTGQQPDDPERDRFVLSKGHASLALYSALHLRGLLAADTLNQYCADGTVLGVHPEHTVPGIDFSTGSLGQGLSMGVGAALAARMQASPRRVFVVLSDGECNEGAIWEAAAFAAHHQLANLTAVVDVNGQQAFGYTQDVLNMGPLADKWRAFGWDVHEVNGHDIDAMTLIMRNLPASGPPHMLIARTTFGKGVSFMENQIQWHYWPMNEAQYRQAKAEVGGVA